MQLGTRIRYLSQVGIQVESMKRKISTMWDFRRRRSTGREKVDSLTTAVSAQRALDFAPQLR